mgnify:CR=1 FL=1
MNTVCYLSFEFKGYVQGLFPSYKTLVQKKYEEKLYKVYPNWDQKDIDQLLFETWNRTFAYESIAQLQEKPFSGKFVNVDENGFRVGKDQGPWPPDQKNFNLFFFGGSTTFGYGLPDFETIPSFLQEELRSKLAKEVRVYNFGRGHHFSSHELFLFFKLIWKGFNPDMVIFLDGLNDFHYADEKDLLWTKYLKKRHEDFENVNLGWTFGKMMENTSAMRMARWVRAHIPLLDSEKPVEPSENERKLIQHALNRYVTNMKIISKLSKAHDIPAFFVWQPVPSFKYNPKYNPFAGELPGLHRLSGPGYPEMEKRFQRGDFKNYRFIWAGDFQEGMTKPLYVDQVHYNAELSRMLASHISDNILRYLNGLS